MSMIVHGAEMPESCGSCIYGWADRTLYVYFCQVLEDCIRFDPDKRPDVCPLKEMRGDSK